MTTEDHSERMKRLLAKLDYITGGFDIEMFHQRLLSINQKSAREFEELMKKPITRKQILESGAPVVIVDSLPTGLTINKRRVFKDRAEQFTISIKEAFNPLIVAVDEMPPVSTISGLVQDVLKNDQSVDYVLETAPKNKPWYQQGKNKRRY